MEYDLFCLGGSSVDILLRAPRLPESDEKLLVQLVGRQAGGLVANTACAAARLGLGVGWSGWVGGDEGGWLLLESFKEFGVDASLAVVVPQGATDFCVTLLGPGGERTILVVPTFPQPPALPEKVRAALRRSRLVYTIPYRLDWLVGLAETVHTGDGLLAVDVETSCPIRGEALREALRHADLVFCSRGGLALASGVDDPQQGAKALLTLGARCAVVTLGSQGAWAFTAQEEAFVPAYPVQAVDTTGAGDCFHAAFMSAYLGGQRLAECARFASAAAALKVQALGPRGGLPGRDQVEALLAK